MCSKMDRIGPIKPDAGNPAIASRFHSGYHWRGVTEPERSTICAFESPMNTTIQTKRRRREKRFRFGVLNSCRPGWPGWEKPTGEVAHFCSLILLMAILAALWVGAMLVK
jgi:hypothetical protein